MEDFDFNTEQSNTEQSNVHKETDNMPNVAGASKSTNNVEFNSHNDNNVPINNEHLINPQIPRDEAPFVVLCGPAGSGKSMVLKCLATYLYKSNSNYSIVPNRTLFAAEEYQSICDKFAEKIGNYEPMPNTVNYLLVDIYDDNNHLKAHFLEAPGEDFFKLNDPIEPGRPFKGYLEQIARTGTDRERKVIYIIILDLDSEIPLRRNDEERQKYETKMVNLYNGYVLQHPSRVILLYNKVDLAGEGNVRWANANGCRNPEEILNDARNNYPRLFFTRKFLFWKMGDYKFLPFCTGRYPEDGSYAPAGAVYPRALWKEITKLW